MLLYSAGAALGPVGAAAMMTLSGSAGLFLFMAACAGGTVAFGLWRQTASEPVPDAEQQDFQMMPRTTPQLAILDPHHPEADLAETDQGILNDE